uniref:Uncharacterized protein n=1 Tax=Callorhinchus milii TaxID=7868 RepID=A0A4W3KD46_CALMI
HSGCDLPPATSAQLFIRTHTHPHTHTHRARGGHGDRGHLNSPSQRGKHSGCHHEDLSSSVQSHILEELALPCEAAGGSLSPTPHTALTAALYLSLSLSLYLYLSISLHSSALGWGVTHLGLLLVFQVLSLSEIVWPCLLFLILAGVRVQNPLKHRANCYMEPRTLPSGGLYPFVQSLFCDEGSHCYGDAMSQKTRSSGTLRNTINNQNGVLSSLQDIGKQINETLTSAANLQTEYEELFGQSGNVVRRRTRVCQVLRDL